MQLLVDVFGKKVVYSNKLYKIIPEIVALYGIENLKNTIAEDIEIALNYADDYNEDRCNDKRFLRFFETTNHNHYLNLIMFLRELEKGNLGEKTKKGIIISKKDLMNYLGIKNKRIFNTFKEKLNKYYKTGLIYLKENTRYYEIYSFMKVSDLINFNALFRQKYITAGRIYIKPSEFRESLVNEFKIETDITKEFCNILSEEYYQVLVLSLVRQRINLKSGIIFKVIQKYLSNTLIEVVIEKIHRKLRFQHKETDFIMRVLLDFMKEFISFLTKFLMSYITAETDFKNDLRKIFSVQIKHFFKEYFKEFDDKLLLSVFDDL